MIPALLIQKNNTVYISPSGISAEKSGGTELLTGVGLATVIPIPGAEGGIIDADYWAIPVKEGLISGFLYKAYNPNDPVGSVKPDPQAFAVFRLLNRLASDDWYVVGTVAQYITAAGGGAALPTTITSLLAGCQTLCQFDENGKYFAVLSLDTLTLNKRYFPYGYWNGVALPSGVATGYLTPATLLTFLNTATVPVLTNGVVTSYTGGWAIVGTWTLSADNMTARAEQTAGPGTDVLCADIASINPSL